MTTLEWIVAVGAGLIAPFLLVTLIGFCFPRAHVVARSITLKQSPATVWESITSFERIPGWWPSCVMVERLPDKDGHAAYRETFLFGRRKQTIDLEVIESVKPSRFATRLTDVGKPLQGRWVYDIERHQGGGARLTLTEFGEVKNPFVRAMFHLMMSKAIFVESYLVCLGAKFGESVVPTARQHP
jgi:uncharacterized protein YndB with AHSA1/START domain